MSDKIRYDSIVMAFMKQTAEDQKPYHVKQAHPEKHNDAASKPNRPPRYCLAVTEAIISRLIHQAPTKLAL